MTVNLSSNRSPAPSLEELTDEILAHWRQDLHQRLEQLQQHPEQGLGFIEEHIRQASLHLQRLLVQKAMQDKAHTVDEKCPDCHSGLCDKKRRVPRWIDAYCGKVKLVRTHGW